jgi:hypothetical protein
MSRKHWWNDTDRAKIKCLFGERIFPVPFCPPQNDTWTSLGPNTGVRGERPVANRLSPGTALVWPWYSPGTALVRPHESK